MHVSEDILEKFYFELDSFSTKERNSILKHLEQCKECEDIYIHIAKFNQEVEYEVDGEPTANDKDFAFRIIHKLENIDETKLLSEKANSIEIYDGKAEIVSKPNLYSLQNIYRFIKNHPFTSFSFAAVCFMAVAFLVTTVKTTFKDKNPVTIELKHSVLYTYNKAGELLWNMNVDWLEDKDILNDAYINGRKKCFYLNDIDGDGLNELLVSGKLPDKGKFECDSLYCFNYNGSKRWVVSPESKEFNYAPKWKRTNWYIVDFFIAFQKKQRILYTIANVETYGGTVLSTLDTSTGKVTSSLYHSGHYSTQFHYDMDNDGDDEIFLGGVSSYDKPFLMVLKQSFVMGVMPDFYSGGHKVKGNAWYYLLLPVSKLSAAAGVYSPSNLAEIKRFEYSGIVCYCDDVAGKTSEDRMRLLFAFAKDFGVKFSNYTSQYKMLYDEMVSKGKIRGDLVSYINTLKDSVKYWDGDKFVNYPTPNKYWKQKFRKP